MRHYSNPASLQRALSSSWTPDVQPQNTHPWQPGSGLCVCVGGGCSQRGCFLWCFSLAGALAPAYPLLMASNLGTGSFQGRDKEGRKGGRRKKERKNLSSKRDRLMVKDHAEVVFILSLVLIYSSCQLPLENMSVFLAVTLKCRNPTSAVHTCRHIGGHTMLISIKLVGDKALFCVHHCLDVLFEILFTVICVH